MEQFIRDIEAYAGAVNRKPQSILRAAVGASWGTWESWKAGKSSPTMIVADRVRAYIAENPPVEVGETTCPNASDAA